MEIVRKALPAYAETFVRSLPQHANGACVIGLSGNLGAGKTTFVQEVARVLGVTANVTSPTFVLVQTYQTAHPVFTTLIHIDAYRLQGEIKDTIGFEEYVKNPHALIFIEWPEFLPGGLPPQSQIILFETIDEERRRIVSKHGF